MVPGRAGVDLLPKGEVERTSFGSHYVVRKAFDDAYFLGKVRLGRFSTEGLLSLMELMRQGSRRSNRNEIVFLDVESTGVQGGTGMCPFLVGIGFFRDDQFHLVQYFIRDFDEEPSMLYALGEGLRQFSLVITYNGAAFDLPLLDARFTLARLPKGFEGMAHFDLLFAARRLWRVGHGSCRLIALERELLSFIRGPDIPGSMIPRVYFDFLHGETSGLSKVFTHNAYDVISLAALTIHASDRVSEEPTPLDDSLDIYSLGRLYEFSPQWKNGIRLYEMAKRAGLPSDYRRRALESLSVLYRRSGQHERSLEVCQQLMKASDFSFPGYEGAAIYYEHAARDPGSACGIVEQGLARLHAEHGRQRWKDLLESRRKRLQQKVIRYED